MKRACRGLMAVFALGLAFTACADEAEIRRVLGAKLRGVTIESVRPGPGGLFEVVLRGDGGARIVYTDAKATVFIDGAVIDARTGRNLTEERMREVTAVKWDSLPFELAFTIKHGKGRRKVAVFSDPNCPYCRKFEGDLAKLGDVTIHLFLYPVIRPESVRQTKAVWCSPDRARAWMDLMFKRIEPRASPDCDTPVETILVLGRKLGATATPTWILTNGQVHSGALPIEEVRRLLDGAAGVTP
ncbi:MAG TPA: DsbC family protein [Burkholderiales bacterium]|nr:DsbC family protein [Burkholderiales bacterium]